MKNILILIILLSSHVVSYSQFFVGDSEEFVKSVFEQNKISFTEAVVTDSTHRISWLVENQFQMIILFNNENIVITQTLIPEGPNGVNGFIKWFDEDYVIVSDTEWKNYENGRVYKIKLKHILGEPFFTISIDP